jgi:hypothetical protein
MLPGLIAERYLAGLGRDQRPQTIAYEARKDLLIGVLNLNVLLTAIEEMVGCARRHARDKSSP